jgi:hypothetical protein
MSIARKMTYILEHQEQNVSLRSLLLWTLSQEEERSEYSMATTAGEVLRTYSVRQHLIDTRGGFLPGNVDLITRLRCLDPKAKVGGYSFFAKNKVSLIIWVDESDSYLGVTQMIFSHDFSSAEYDHLESNYKRCEADKSCSSHPS